MSDRVAKWQELRERTENHEVADVRYFSSDFAKIVAAYESDLQAANAKIALLEEYVKLLGESEAKLVGIAYVHGVQISDEMAERGRKIREQLAALSTEEVTHG